MGDPERTASPKPLTAEQREFVTEQYRALRAEILAIKERVIRLLVLLVTGIPVVMAAGEKYDLGFVILTSPVVTLIAILMIIFEQASLMRAGQFVRLHVEPMLVGRRPPPKTWEDFLETEPENRRVEWYLAYAAYAVFVLYYVLGMMLAYKACERFVGHSGAVMLMSFYLGAFAVSLTFVVQNFRTRQAQAAAKPAYPSDVDS